MHRRYITFISLLVVAMFSIMPFSQISPASVGDIQNDYSPYASWHLGGYVQMSGNGNSIALHAHVTSYASSSGRPTELYFNVCNGKSSEYVYTTDVGGTGTYSYTWNPNMAGDIHFSVVYVACVKGKIRLDKHELLPPPPNPVERQCKTLGTSSLVVHNSWALSGNTYATMSDGRADLYINVTHYSSEYNIPTELCFIAEHGSDISTLNSISINGKGTYRYSYTPSSALNCCFFAKYLSSAGSSSHYSTFGMSIVNVKSNDYIGYDGNNTIYLSSPHSGSYMVYGYSKLPDVEQSIDKCGGSNIEFENDSVVMEPSYIVCNDSGQLKINIAIIAAGASNDFCTLPSEYSPSTVYTAAYQRLGLTTDGVPSGAISCINTGKNSGINVTGPNEKGKTPSEAFEGILINLVSLAPWAGYFTSQESIYQDLYALSGVDSYSLSVHGNGTIYQNYEIDGGNACVDSKGKNVFGSVEDTTISIPLNELKNSFKINTFSTNYYECIGPTGIIKSANASEAITTTPSSAIYGTVGLTPACSDGNHNYDTSLNSSVYIKSVNSGDFFKVPIKNGHYLFFAKPDTKYELFYRSGSNFEKFKNNSGSIISYINSQNPGQSNSINLYE